MSSDITSTSLTLTWAPPANPNGVIRHYIIRAVEINTRVNLTYQAQSRTTFTVGDLHPYYTYQFNVHAVTVELGPASLNHTVTTLQDGEEEGYTHIQCRIYSLLNQIHLDVNMHFN